MPDSPLKDKNYNLVSAVHSALQTEYTMAQYAQDAQNEGDQELAQFFRDVIESTKQTGEAGKRLLAARLQDEGG